MHLPLRITARDVEPLNRRFEDARRRRHLASVERCRTDPVDRGATDGAGELDARDERVLAA